MSLLNKLAEAQNREAQALETIDPVFLANIQRPLLTQRLERYITQHEATRKMLRRAQLAAPYVRTVLPNGLIREPVSVLIHGPSGTGKELVARIMLGSLPDTQFYAINCAGIVDTLFESLLFGHVHGAFTGSTGNSKGALVAAKDGVVFFDEVGELPLMQQAKLLRAIQERCVTPVGSTETIPIRCRMVFATNRNLQEMCLAGQFREDLYHRISTLTLETFPLHVRPDDAVLIMHDFCARRNIDVPDEPIPASVILSAGNVRALENWIIRNNIWHNE